MITAQQLACPVCRAVVDDQQLEAVRDARFQHRRHGALDRAPLVVGRHDHRDLGRG
jgi:hypothetical protein